MFLFESAEKIDLQINMVMSFLNEENSCVVPK